MKNDILILGDGLLGSEIIKQTDWDYVSRKKDNVDLDEILSIVASNDKSIIVNCIANTDTYSNNREKHWSVNYFAVSDLVDICNANNQKLIHISTDYLYSGSNDNASENDVPVHNNTWYGYTKLLGDAHIQLKSKSSKGPFETYIYDLNGKLMGKQLGETISLINFQKGIYLLKVKFGKKEEDIRVVKI